jgi:dienelactone hydrolase
MRELCASLGERASLHVVAEADHSFHVPKRSGRTDEEAAEDLVSAVDAWIRRLGVP